MARAGWKEVLMCSVEGRGSWLRVRIFFTLSVLLVQATEDLSKIREVFFFLCQ